MEFQSYPKMGTISYQFGPEVKVVRLEPTGQALQITVADRVYEVSVIHSRADELTIRVNGITHTVSIATEDSTHYVAIDGDVFELKRPDPRRVQRKQHHGEDDLIASMPGQVTKVLVNDGDSVQRGQPLLVLEAMKMEIKITAPHDGRVARVLVYQGQLVERGQALIELAGD